MWMDKSEDQYDGTITKRFFLFNTKLKKIVAINNYYVSLSEDSLIQQSYFDEAPKLGAFIPYYRSSKAHKFWLNELAIQAYIHSGQNTLAFMMAQHMAKLDSETAQYYLGVLYEAGKGTDQDDELAFAWFSKAAALNYSDAQYMLYLMYKDGIGVTKDLSIAQSWLMKASKQGNKKARDEIRKLSRKGGK